MEKARRPKLRCGTTFDKTRLISTENKWRTFDMIPKNIHHQMENLLHQNLARFLVCLELSMENCLHHDGLSYTYCSVDTHQNKYFI